MKKVLFFLAGMMISTSLFAWGATGHRTVAEIADRHLSDKAREAINAILGKETLVLTSTWMDEIKSDSKYKDHSPWHYVTIPDGKTYDDIEKSEKGDVISTITRMVKELKGDDLTQEEKRDRIAALAHLVGDIHQPLHVGRPDDRGGNNVMVTWFGEVSNLHRVWDSEMIDSYQMGYSELADNLDKSKGKEIKKLQKASVMDWAYESMSYREQIYDIGNAKLGYKYAYDNFNIVKTRLNEGGIRLAGLLNDIFG